MKVELVAYTPNPEEVIGKAACTCYNAKTEKYASIIKQCYLHGHHSVLEHASFTFKVEGVSRALMAQLTRHRMASFSIMSQRYCDMKGSNCVVPDSIMKSSNPDVRSMFFGALSNCQMAYEFLQNNGIPNEDARFILPEAMSTTITFTMNLRELIHLCNERLCTCAQWEIRRMVGMAADEVNKATECAFEYMLVPKCEKNLEYPFCTEGKRGCGRHPLLEELYTKEQELIVDID